MLPFLTVFLSSVKNTKILTDSQIFVSFLLSLSRFPFAHPARRACFRAADVVAKKGENVTTPVRFDGGECKMGR